MCLATSSPASLECHQRTLCFRLLHSPHEVGVLSERCERDVESDIMRYAARDCPCGSQGFCDSELGC